MEETYDIPLTYTPREEGWEEGCKPPHMTYLGGVFLSTVCIKYIKRFDIHVCISKPYTWLGKDLIP